MTSPQRKMRFSPSLAEEALQLPQEKKELKRGPLRGHESAPDRHSFEHLARVLVSGKRDDMLNAVDRLHGRSRVLVELACFSGFQFVRLAAISNLSQDPEALIDIARFCPHEDTRAAALDELSTRADAVVEVACSSLFKDTRLSAVSLLAGSQHLADVALRSPNPDSRSAAIESLSSQPAALKKVAQLSPYRPSRKLAMKHLASQVPALAALLLSARHADVKREAAWLLSAHVEDLDDVDTLIEIAKLSANQDARYLAIGRLWRHPRALHRVVFESRYHDARSTALMLLSDMVSTLDDSELLSQVAILSPYSDCRSAAIERLEGQSAMLLSVASKSRFSDARKKALDKLRSDVEAVKNVAKLSKYRDTRSQAHKIVSDPQVFQAELARILG